MRRWTRDRNRRRKPQGEKPAQEAPAPLQPKFPEPPEYASSERRQPEFEAQPDEAEVPELQSSAGDAGEERGQQPKHEFHPGAANTGGARTQGRSRRRGRRGRGNRQPPVMQAPTLPGPGGPTGEAAEAEVPPETVEPVAQPAPPTRQPKGAVVLSIGLPGSGKSTWFKRHNILPLSSDMVRILLFDDVTEQRYQDLVFSTLRSMLRARLLARRPWNYLDATNLSPHERRSWIKLAHDFGYEVHAVFFDVPPEVCIERNRRRDRNVPEDVMQRMAQKLRAPKFEEGFAKITVVRLKKKESEAPQEEPRQEFAVEPDEGEPPEIVDADY
ncbi:MAG TPA: AAA family ATPase [Terriglobales bacterium]|nr:AAA family ATPase [Terriglobales bacterium]